jgi:hypothetical protein
VSEPRDPVPEKPESDVSGVSSAPPLTGIARTARELAGLSWPPSKAPLGLGAVTSGSLVAGLGAFPSGGLAAGLIGATLAQSETVLTGALIADWRKQLADAHAPIQRAIALQMSETFTGLGLGALGALGTADLGRTMFGGVAESLAELTEGWRKQITAAFAPLAFSASKLLTVEMRAASARDRAGLERLRHLGWWIPPSEDYSFMRLVSELAVQGRRMEVRREMLALAASRRYGDIVDNWFDLAPFRERKRFIADGLRDHRKGRYRVSIPTLLPHLEGILTQVFPPPPTKKVSMVNLVASAVSVTNAVMGELTVDVATVLWQDIAFEETLPADRRLNRHLILHGRSTGWASQVNSARVLFAFDLVASLVKDAERNKGHKKAGG